MAQKFLILHLPTIHSRGKNPFKYLLEVRGIFFFPEVPANILFPLIPKLITMARGLGYANWLVTPAFGLGRSNSTELWVRVRKHFLEEIQSTLGSGKDTGEPNNATCFLQEPSIFQFHFIYLLKALNFFQFAYFISLHQ